MVRTIPGSIPFTFSAKGRWFLVKEDDHNLVVLDLITQKRVLHIPFTSKYHPPATAFSPDGNLLAAAFMDTTILLYDMKALAKRGGE